MFFKKNFTIEMDTIPKTVDDMCLAVAGYCAENNLWYEFIKRTEPLIAIIDGRQYEITKRFTRHYHVNLWVLRCKEMV